MSLCQPANSKFSCGACCGFLNLKLSKNETLELLKSRTNELKNSVDFQKYHSFAAYRQSRENQENGIPKFDETTYNCPFLGYIESEKIGCMIHPEATKNPKSQNFSFYGTSICQGYDCKNKEKQTAEHWEKFLSNLELDSFSYSLIAGDHVSLSKIEKYVLSLGFNENEIFSKAKEFFTLLIEKLIQLRESGNEKSYVTSFETDYSSALDDPSHALCERLCIQKDSELFTKTRLL